MSSITDARCHACEGKGIVWPPAPAQTTFGGDSFIIELKATIASQAAEIDSLRALTRDMGRELAIARQDDRCRHLEARNQELAAKIKRLNVLFDVLTEVQSISS